MYSTRIKKCVVPHYKKTGGDSDELFKNWNINSVFESEVELYDRFGHRMSSAISGMCIADLFTQFGLTQRDEYVKSLFSTISCYQGKDSIVSFLVANRPYRIRNTEITDIKCPDNVVFEKGTLILPRGELMCALLGIPGDRIANSNDPNHFKIYIHKVTGTDKIEAIKKEADEFDNHFHHLKVKDVTKIEPNATAAQRPAAYYVTLNPFIYTRMKAYRCIPQDGRNLEEQYFMLHKMNLLFSQTLGAMSVIPVEARRLLQYPPGTRESICCENDILNVSIPNNVEGGNDFDSWAIKEEGNNIGRNNDGFTYGDPIPKNTIIFPEVKDTDLCKTNRENFHSFIQQFENTNINKIREEYSDIKIDVAGFPEYYDDNQRAFWYKFIKNTYPTRLTFLGDEISKFTPNCQLTPLGVVAIKKICEGDPLIFKENEMKIDQIHIPNRVSPFDCLIERVDIPDYKRLHDGDRAGEVISKQRVHANPLTYTPAFVTSLGTNITILPKQPL